MMYRTLSRITLMVTFLCLGALATAPVAVAQEDASWDTLMQAEFKRVTTDDGWVWTPEFTEDIEGLDSASVRVSGYMIPLGYDEKQTHFLISAYPGDGCYFHLPGGPNSVVEVRAAEGVAFTYDTIAIEGRLVLLRDDPYGLMYRMADAQPAK